MIVFWQTPVPIDSKPINAGRTLSFMNTERSWCYKVSGANCDSNISALAHVAVESGAGTFSHLGQACNIATFNASKTANRVSSSG